MDSLSPLTEHEQESPEVLPTQQQLEWEEWMFRLAILQEYAKAKPRFEHSYVDSLVEYMRLNHRLTNGQKAAVQRIMSTWNVLNWYDKHNIVVSPEPYPFRDCLFQ